MCTLASVGGLVSMETLQEGCCMVTLLSVFLSSHLHKQTVQTQRHVEALSMAAGLFQTSRLSVFLLCGVFTVWEADQLR